MNAEWLARPMMWPASQWPGSERWLTTVGLDEMLACAGRALACRVWRDRRRRRLERSRAPIVGIRHRNKALAF